MKIRRPTISYLAAGLIFGGLGCKKAVAPPAPVAIEQVAPTIEKAFQQAPAETRQIASDVAVAVQGNDDVKAFNELQDLNERSELTPQQREAVTRSLLAVQQRLRQAAEKGNKKAEETLEHYRATK